MAKEKSKLKDPPPFRRTGYHAVRPKWRQSNNNPGPGFKVGIELEVEHPQGWGKVTSAMPKLYRNRPVLEADGSLDYHRGIEIVFPPYSISTLKDKNSNFQRTIRAVKDAGTEVPDTCGMHFNVNTSGWSESKKYRFTGFILTLPRQVLESIGGRRLGRYCDIPRLLLNEGVFSALYWACHGSHGYAVSPRDGRIEVRFPAATLNLDKINFIVYFLKIMEEYAGRSEEVPALMHRPDSAALALIEFVKSARPASSRRSKLLRILSA